MDIKLKISSSAKGFYENKNSVASKMRRSISDKTLLHISKRKKIDDSLTRKSNRFLITINIFGSAGPIRFVVNGDNNAGEVIATALKKYAREERLPVLGSDISRFFLYSASDGFYALQASEPIGLRGARNFVLCKKQISDDVDMSTEKRSDMIGRKGSKWRAWIHKHLTLKVLSH